MKSELEKLQYQKSNAKETLETIQSEVDSATQSANNIFSLTEETINKQKEKIEAELNTYIKDIEEQKKQKNYELEKICSSITSLNRQYIQETQEKEKLNQNRLNISEDNISDIELLDSIKLRFSNPRIINKLIWQTYYQPLAKTKFAAILDNKTKTGIYKITNINDNKIYIGQAVDIYKRWCDHCKAGCGIDTPANNKLYKAMSQDGLYNFRFELLEECQKEDLNEKEKFYINLYESVTYGYNSMAGQN